MRLTDRSRDGETERNLADRSRVKPKLKTRRPKPGEPGPSRDWKVTFTEPGCEEPLKVADRAALVDERVVLDGGEVPAQDPLLLQVERAFPHVGGPQIPLAVLKEGDQQGLRAALRLGDRFERGLPVQPTGKGRRARAALAQTSRSGT